MEASCGGKDWSELPELVLLRVADFLTEEDTTRLRMTCRRFHSLLPSFLVMRGPDFSLDGSGTGWGDMEPYFDGTRLCAGVERLTVSVVGWKDQGWGNRKGELFVRLMRDKVGGAGGKVGGGATRVVGKVFSRMWNRGSSNKAEEEIVVERRDFFGLAEHYETSASLELDERESVVESARPGDWYRFMRRAGGGGGHRLIVRGFRAVAALKQHA